MLQNYLSNSLTSGKILKISYMKIELGQMHGEERVLPPLMETLRVGLVRHTAESKNT